MRNITKSVLVAGVAVFTVTSLIAKSGGGHGTDVLHFAITENMQNEGVEPDASGTVRASENKQGNANNQSLQISVKGLTPDSTYSLFAAVGGDTNLTSVSNSDFTTDGHGNARISYRS